MLRPIAILASSACAATGPTVSDFETALLAGCSGLRAPEFALPFQTVCGELTEPLAALAAELQANDSRQARLLAHLYAAIAPEVDRARARWGDTRIGIFLGTSNAGIAQSEWADGERRATGVLPPAYNFARQHGYNGALEVIRALSGARGPGWINSTACSSSAKVLACAQRLIAADVLDAAIVGGADTLCQTTLRGFHGLGVLSSTACRPFSAARDGISIGEGGALLLVARQGDGQARLLAVGETSDAHHMSAPHPAGDGALAAMRQALTSAGLAADDIDHINAHGTATQQNDAAEGEAIRRLVGDRVPVVSTKGYTGHLLGAAAAIELVAALHALRTGWIPASLGATPLDPALGIAVATTGTHARVRVVMSNSFAFGGNNASVLLGAP